MTPGVVFQEARKNDPWGLFFVLTVCLGLQLASATFLVRDVSSPNAATVIATALVHRGEFAVRAWPRTARTADGGEEPLRAYHLPAEPLLLAAGFRVLPAALTRYLHVPVTVLLVGAIVVVAFRIAGRAAGIAAGVVASIDPFVLWHGPVWDDAFLAAALEWAAFALIVTTVRAAPEVSESGGRAVVTAGLIVLVAGLAALTRTSSQVVLGLAGAGLLVLPVFRPFRAAGAATLIGVAVALAAWGGRNYAVLGEFQTGSSHDGITLFESNYATARPLLLRTGTVETYELEALAPHFAAVATMSEFDANRYFIREAVEYARSHPGDVIATAAVKSATTLTGVNPALPLTTARNLVAATASLAVLVAGIFGWRLIARGADRPEVRVGLFLAIVVTIVTCLGMLAGPAGLRYRLSATAFLYLGGGVVVSRLSRQMAKGSFCLLPFALCLLPSHHHTRPALVLVVQDLQPRFLDQPPRFRLRQLTEQSHLHGK